jgi:hypothetical protein
MSEAARDPRGLVEIITAFEQDGFACSMTPLAGGSIRCGECGQFPPAGDFALAALRRTEGASDPGDMSAIAAVTARAAARRALSSCASGPRRARPTRTS